MGVRKLVSRTIFSLTACIVSACSREDSRTQVADSQRVDTAISGADLMTLPIDSVPWGTGRYIEATRSYVPGPDTTHWLIVTRRNAGDFLRLAKGPVAHTAPTIVTLPLGVHAADSIGVGTCRLDHGPVNREIVAVLDYAPGEDWLHARRAWRFKRGSSGFEKLMPGRVDCANEDSD